MTAPPVISLPRERPQVAQMPGPLASYLREHCHAAPATTLDRPPQSTGRRTRERAGTQRRARKSLGRQTNRPAKPAQKSRESKRCTRDRSSDVSSHDKPTNPDTHGLACSRCGSPIRYPNEHRCEDCFAEDVDRWPGNDQSAIIFM
jgi:hypothetical protein